jgi:mycothiol system anti-sigma-R factor
LVCEQTQSVAHAYLDGELDAVRSAEFERHLDTCEACANIIASWDEVRSGIHRAGLREIAPASLRQRVYAATRSSQNETAEIAPQRRVNPYAIWLAIAVAVVLAAVLTYKFIPSRAPSPTQQLAAQIVDAHLRSLQPGHLMDVVSTDQHTVKPWFDGKLDFAPTVGDFADQGFPLEGGRLDVAGGRTVAALIYGHRKHVISVFIWPDPQPDSQRHSAQATQTGSLQGYNWIEWHKAGMDNYAVSDTSSADLQQLQSLLAQ